MKQRSQARLTQPQLCRVKTWLAVPFTGCLLELKLAAYDACPDNFMTQHCLIYNTPNQVRDIAAGGPPPAMPQMLQPRAALPAAYPLAMSGNMVSNPAATSALRGSSAPGQPFHVRTCHLLHVWQGVHAGCVLIGWLGWKPVCMRGCVSSAFGKPWTDIMLWVF